MKKLFIYIVGVLMLTACDDFLTRSPLSDLSPENYFKDKAEMANWNAGIYSAFQSALQNNQVIYGDCRSDNVETTGYINNNIYMNALLPSMSEASWQTFYQCISRCNVGIEMYPTIPSILESEYAPYIGQAYGMRAYMYFWMTRVWGELPLITASWDGSLSTIQVPRASLQEVKQQILTDIDQAIRYFTITNTASVFYLSLAAMYELKTEVHMWYNEYDEALRASDYFLSGGGKSSYQLAQDEVEWKNIFEAPQNSKEVIFAMSWDYVNNGASSGWPKAMGASNTNNGYQMSLPMFQTFVDRLYSGEGSDARLWCTLDTVRLYYNASRSPMSYAHYYATGIQKCIKYSHEDPDREYDTSNKVYKAKYKVLNTTDSEIQQVFMRLTNVYMLRAEALNKLGRAEEALQLINQCRTRVGYLKDATTEVDMADAAQVESLILLERQLEFYGEGQRWFDLMRTGHLMEVMDPVYSMRQQEAGVVVDGFGDEGRQYWPIYYREFESNAALVGCQNYPYNER